YSKVALPQAQVLHRGVFHATQNGASREVEQIVVNSTHLQLFLAVWKRRLRLGRCTGWTGKKRRVGTIWPSSCFRNPVETSLLTRAAALFEPVSPSAPPIAAMPG